MLRPFRDWNRFWFEPQTTRVLGLFRILIGLITIYSFALFAKDTTLFFSDAGVLTSATLKKVMGRDYHTILVWITSPGGVKLVLSLLFAAAFFFTIGLKTRLSAVLLYVFVISFHERNNLVLNSGDVVLRAMIFFFVFSPSRMAFSVDSLIARLKEPEESASLPRVAPLWTQRMMQLQVALIYVVTVYAKSRGGLWHGGEALYYVWGLVDFHVQGVEQLMNYSLLYSTLTFVTLFVEIALPFLLWFRVSRPYAILLGLGLQGWIFFFMTLPVFPTLMMAAMLPFVTEKEFEKVLDWIKNRFEKSRAKVFYDGHCPLCRRSIKIVRLLDLFERVMPVDLHTATLEEKPGGISTNTMMKEMHLVTAKKKILKGFDAFRWMAVRMPATFVLAPFLYLPGIPVLGRPIYRRVASSRTIDVPDACDGRCAIH